ncbi:MAG: hypothetical protein O3C43_05040, partial [Verrucomicrobia bacterium]|nr:hypothetical protein [Verrucomicrobiota bacterium]
MTQTWRNLRSLSIRNFMCYMVLGTYFKQSPRFWLNIQTECDVRSALKDASALTSHIKPYEAVAESGGSYEA